MVSSLSLLCPEPGDSAVGNKGKGWFEPRSPWKRVSERSRHFGERACASRRFWVCRKASSTHCRDITYASSCPSLPFPAVPASDGRARGACGKEPWVGSNTFTRLLPSSGRTSCDLRHISSSLWASVSTPVECGRSTRFPGKDPDRALLPFCSVGRRSAFDKWKALFFLQTLASLLISSSLTLPPLSYKDPGDYLDPPGFPISRSLP